MRQRAASFFSIATAQVILAALLLCAIASLCLPLAPVFADSNCRLACCAGRAPHAAGSCAKGSCRAALHAPSPRRFTGPSETFCGAARRLSLIAVSQVAKVVNSASINESDLPKGSAAALIAPGAPDCRGIVSVCVNLKGQHDSASVTYTENAPPPANICFGKLRENLARARDASGRRYAPRGPPVFFS